MKLDINREKFAHFFGIASSAAPVRSTKPVLTRVLCVANDDVKLIATDREISIELIVEDCNVLHPGSVLFDTARMRDILRESSAERLAIEVDENNVVVSGGFSLFSLPTENPAEYPKPQFESSSDGFQVPSELLRQAISLTSFATDVDSTRFALGGVLVEGDTDETFFVATDGRRLSRYVLTGGRKCNGIIPSRAMNAINKALASGEVTVSIGTKGALFEAAGVKLQTVLVEGRFPSWRQVIPRQDGETVEIPAGVLASLVRQAAICCDPESRGVLISVTKGEIQISSDVKDVGKGNAKSPIAYDGDDLIVMLDHKFTSDWLSRVDPAKIIGVDIKSDKEPVVLTCDQSLYVVMPMARDKVV